MNDVNNSYGIFTAGFIVVLLVSIGCNICISKFRHKAIRTKVDQQKIDIQNSKSSDRNILESVSVNEISNNSYETINENDMAMSISADQEHQIHIQNRNKTSTTQFDNSYLEVISDKGYSASCEADNDHSSIVTSSKSKVKSAKVNSVELYIDNNREDDITSYLSMDKSHFEDFETSTPSHSPIHVTMCSENEFIKKEVHSTKTIDYMNNYFTLNACDIDNCYNYCTSRNPNIDNVGQNATQSCVKGKRHSCP